MTTHAPHGTSAATSTTGTATGSATPTPTPPAPSSGGAGTGSSGPWSVWARLGLLAFITWLLSIPTVRQIVFGVLAAPFLAVIWVLVSIFGPRGWLVQLFGWLAGTGTPAAAAFLQQWLWRIRLGLLILIVSVSLGLYFGEERFIAFILVLLGLITFLFFRAINLAPGTAVWGLTGRMQMAFGTLTMGLFFLAILALAAQDVLPTLTFRSWLMLALLAFVLSSARTLAGTGGEFGRWIMKWGSVALVLAVVVLQLFNFGTSPVLIAGGEAVTAISQRSASELLGLAKKTEPGIPLDLDRINREAQKKIIANEIAQMQRGIDLLVEDSQRRILTDYEMQSWHNATARIKKRQEQMQNLGYDSSSVRVFLWNGLEGTAAEPKPAKSTPLIAAGTVTPTPAKLTAVNLSGETINTKQCRARNGIAFNLTGEDRIDAGSNRTTDFNQPAICTFPGFKVRVQGTSALLDETPLITGRLIVEVLKQ